jgi:hypothetical protein
MSPYSRAMGQYLEGHPAIPSGWCLARSVPWSNLYAQVPTASGSHRLHSVLSGS